MDRTLFDLILEMSKRSYLAGAYAGIKIQATTPVKYSLETKVNESWEEFIKQCPSIMKFKDF